jgi:outer membrane protein TolC
VPGGLLAGEAFAGQSTSQTSGQAAGQAAAPATGQALPLTMEQAVAMALEANLGLKAERLNLDIASHSVALARSAFLPRLDSSLGRRTSKSVPSDFTQGSTDISSAGLSVSGSVSQNIRWFGGSYSLTWSGNRSTQIGGLSSFNPRLSSSLQVNFSQPLLRDLVVDSARNSLATSARQREITDIQLRGRIVATEASVRLAYLSLVGAIEGKKVAEQNMAIAQRSLEQSRARVKVGQSPQIEIIQSEAQVASNEEQLILADAQIATAEDNLRSLILEPGRADYWEVRLVPTDTIQLTAREIDLNDAIRNALANRLDLAAQKRSLEITNLNLRVGRNNTLPAVDFNVSYSASGTAGTQFEFGSGFPPPIIDRTDRTFGSALGDTFGGAYPSWSVGVTVSYPVGRTSAEIAYAQSQVQKRQQELGLQDLQLQIVREVRDAARQVQNSFQRVQATRTFREAAEQQLEAEERRFAVGISTTLDLQIRQSQLASARTSELNAMIAYNRALIILDRVQKTQ